MRTLSDHLFELVRNSIDAGAQRIRVVVDEQPEQNLFQLIVEDDGRGMNKRMLAKVKDPFFTHRSGKHRRLGLGIPMMVATCEQAGGSFEIESHLGKGTTITATMEHNNIDRPPLGDLADLFLSLVSITEHRLVWVLEHHIGKNEYRIKSREIYEACGSPKVAFQDFQTQAKRYLYDKERQIGATTEGASTH